MLKVKREKVMRNEKSQFNNIGISSEPDMPRIRHLMKIGLAAGVMVLIGDILLGYGASDATVSGIPVTFARYLTVSDIRIFWSAVLGLIGIPLECLCYFAVYRLIVQKSEKYAHTYRTGIFGCLIFGGLQFVKSLLPDTPFRIGFTNGLMSESMIIWFGIMLVWGVIHLRDDNQGITR